MMKYRTRKLIKPGDLNPRGTLFGGRILEWIDEEAAIFAICQLNSPNIVTKAMSEINFVTTGKLGDVIEFGMELAGVGTTSITIACDVRNKQTKQSTNKKGLAHHSQDTYIDTYILHMCDIQIHTFDILHIPKGTAKSNTNVLGCGFRKNSESTTNQTTHIHQER